MNKFFCTTLKLGLLVVFVACAPKQRARPYLKEPAAEAKVITHTHELRPLKSEKKVELVQIKSADDDKNKEQITWVKSVVEVKNLKVQMNTGMNTVKIEGQAVVHKQDQVNAELEVALKLTGKINVDTGDSELKSEDAKETKILTSARWFCLDWTDKQHNECASYVIEVYIRQGERVYSSQFDLINADVKKSEVNTEVENENEKEAEKEDNTDQPAADNADQTPVDDGDIEDDPDNAQKEGTGSYIMGPIPDVLIGGAKATESIDTKTSTPNSDSQEKIDSETATTSKQNEEKVLKAEAEAATAAINKEEAQLHANEAKDQAVQAKAESAIQEKLAKEAEAKAEKEKTEKAIKDAAAAKEKADQAQKLAEAKAKQELEAQALLKQQQEAKVLADQRAKEAKDAKEAKEAKDAKKAKEAKEAKAAKDAKAEQDAKAAKDVITEKPESKKATDAKSNKTVQPEPIKQPEPEATSTKNTDSANTSNDELEQEPGGVYKNPVVDYVINSLGKSNRGSQKNAMSLLEKISSLKGSAPTSVVRPKQQRYYGNPVMINFIVDVSYQLQNTILKDSEWVSEVSDISRKRGGQLSPHKSHQNGLDADIGYLIRDKRSGYYGKDIVNGSRLSSEFLLDEQYEWFKTMNKKQEGKVYCMFVHKVIKREMCRHAQQKSEYFGENDSRNNPLTVEMLRRLQSRPTDHHNHFHLRLKCPANNKGCFEANELSRRSGCE